MPGAGLVSLTVIAVLNLAAPLPVTQHAQPEMLAIHAWARSQPVPRGRGAPALGISDSLPPSRGRSSGDTEYYGVDKCSERGGM